MNYRWRRIMTALGLLGCLAMVSSACVIRARAHVRAKPVYVVDVEPPPPQYRTDIRERPGYVWIRGHWEWRGNSWFWVEGRWESARQGYVFAPGQWERRGNRWHWVEGRWVVGTGPDRHKPPRVVKRPRPRGPSRVIVEYPTAPPPAPRVVKRPKPRTGYIWVEGRWDWRNGDWEWIPGHWERARTGYVWESGRWELQGDRYVWVEGRWVQHRGGPGPIVRDHRRQGPTAPPPAPRVVKRPKPRTGYIWVEGRWDWRNGDWEWIPGHWERARSGYVWQPGSWQLQGGIYVWIEGQWVEQRQGGPRVRDHRRRAPADRPTERVPTRRGY